jgi:hypothetical protein
MGENDGIGGEWDWQKQIRKKQQPTQGLQWNQPYSNNAFGQDTGQSPWGLPQQQWQGFPQNTKTSIPMAPFQGAIQNQFLNAINSGGAGIQAGANQIGDIMQGNATRIGENNRFNANQAQQRYMFDETNKLARDKLTSMGSILSQMWGGAGTSLPKTQAEKMRAYKETLAAKQATAAPMDSITQAKLAQSAAGESLYDRLLRGIGQQAMPTASIGNVAMAGAGGVPQAGLKVGAPAGMPGLGPYSSPGAVTGFGITPPKVWGEANASALRQALGKVGGKTIPALAGNSAVAQNFKDFLGGLSARTYSKVGRAGTQAQAGQDLGASQATADLRNNIWRQVAQMYGGGMDDQLEQLRQSAAMLRYV